MGLKLDYIDGQTPLDEDEKEGLLISTITTRGDLDEFEQLNIEKAHEWFLTRNFTAEQVLTEEFVKNLHKKMLGDVWHWAGSFRNSNKNIGSDKYVIGIDLKQLLDDCKYWVEHKTYDEDEIAVRFSHRIVKIHCFPNGNGRHSRMIGDILNEKVFKNKQFTWGGANLASASEIRTKYINALIAADEGDYSALLKFVRE